MRAARIRFSLDGALHAPQAFAKALGKTALGVVLLAPLAGCGAADRMKTSSIAMDDYRARHPIVLAKDTTSVDLFPSMAAGGLDRRTAKQIYAFASDYRQVGSGPILVLVPTGGSDLPRRSTVAAIRAAFAASGVNAGIDVTTYPVANPGLASPVRISFVGIKAKVGDQCGQWPSDLASGSNVDSWDNKSYYNFGCATQSVIAAQTADPRDLVTPRGEEQADTLVRSRAIENIRKGTDPSTTWAIHNSSIGTVGGN